MLNSFCLWAIWAPPRVVGTSDPSDVVWSSTGARLVPLSAQVSVCFQATGADQAVGFGLVAFSLLLFAYYSVWVVVLVSSSFGPTSSVSVLPLLSNIAHFKGDDPETGSVSTRPVHIGMLLCLVSRSLTGTTSWTNTSFLGNIWSSCLEWQPWRCSCLWVSITETWRHGLRDDWS